MGSAATVAVPQAVTTVRSGPAFAWTETENYLILGTDRRVVEFQPGARHYHHRRLRLQVNRAAVLSVPRDLYLEIPSYGFGRINQVDYIGGILKTPGGGPALISTVLSNTLGIATVHFGCVWR